MAVVGYFNPRRDTIKQLEGFNAEQCSYIYHSEHDLLENASEGDVVVLDGLTSAGEDLEHALAFLHRVHERGLDFVCVEDALDSRSTQELYPLVEAMYKVAVQQARERRAGQGDATTVPVGAPRRGGRGRAAIAPETVDEALRRYEGGETVRVICEELGLSQGTLYRYARERGISRK